MVPTAPAKYIRIQIFGNNFGTGMDSIHSNGHWGGFNNLKVIPAMQPLTVIGGSGSGTYVVGTAVTISTTPPIGLSEGYGFKGWEFDTDVTFAGSDNKNYMTARIIMPDEPVTATAVYGELGDAKLIMAVNYTQGGTAESDIDGDGECKEGDRAFIEATPNEGWRFVRWSSSGGGAFTDVYNAKTYFTVPPGYVTVTAHFESIYTFNVYGLPPGASVDVNTGRISWTAEGPERDYRALIVSTYRESDGTRNSFATAVTFRVGSGGAALPPPNDGLPVGDGDDEE
jgi:hypothetical protein